MASTLHTAVVDDRLYKLVKIEDGCWRADVTGWMTREAAMEQHRRKRYRNVDKFTLLCKDGDDEYYPSYVLTNVSKRRS